MVTVDLSWTDNASSEDGFNVYRTTGTNPSFSNGSGDYSQIANLSADTTTFTDTNAPADATVHYAVTAVNDIGESLATKAQLTTETITYTFTESDGSYEAPVAEHSEDISNIGTIKVDYIDGGAGEGSNAGSGGRVENVVADVSNYDTLYIWVAGSDSFRYNTGRYVGGTTDQGFNYGGGSTEISVVNKDEHDTDTAPFIAAAGGGGSAYSEGTGPFALSRPGSGGARDGQHFSGTAPGTAPPLGGDGGTESSPDGKDGFGAVSGHGSSVPIIDSGTTIKGGGSSTVDGEVQITYQPTFKPPTNVSTSVSQDDVTISWNAAQGASKYNVLRAEASGTTASDYTTVATVTDDGSASFSVTDSALEDGEKFFYRIESVL